MNSTPSTSLQLLWIGIVIVLGGTQALQAAMLGAMGRLRGPIESSWYSIIGTLTLICLIVTVKAVTGQDVVLPGVLSAGVVTGLLALIGGAVLVYATNGIPWYFGVTGLLAGPYLIAASLLAPRLGVGLFFGAVVTGQLIGGLLLDHLGAFGATRHPVDAMKIAGVVLLLAGVILIRGRH